MKMKFDSLVMYYYGRICFIFLSFFYFISFTKKNTCPTVMTASLLKESVTKRITRLDLPACVAYDQSTNKKRNKKFPKNG